MATYEYQCLNEKCRLKINVDTPQEKCYLCNNEIELLYSYEWEGSANSGKPIVFEKSKRKK